MSEWYWFLIIAALVAVAFAPCFLKGKCSQCGKRKLYSIDIDESLASRLPLEDRKSFLSFYRCEGCGRRFCRQRSQPLQDASESKWDFVFERDHH